VTGHTMRPFELLLIRIINQAEYRDNGFEQLNP
jgi:hypothetical protein